MAVFEGSFSTVEVCFAFRICGEYKPVDLRIVAVMVMRWRLHVRTKLLIGTTLNTCVAQESLTTAHDHGVVTVVLDGQRVAQSTA